MSNSNLMPMAIISEEEARKRIQAMNLIDGFLFDSVLENEKDAIVIVGNILSTVYNERITNITITPQKSLNGLDTNLHGIRFDAKVNRESDGTLSATISDIEMENRPADKPALPRRLRYYGALSDDKLLKASESYLSLPNFVTITISSYDPFDAGDMYYEAHTVLTTHPKIPYDDGITHIFLYCYGKINDGLDMIYGKKLKEMLKYIVSGEKPTSPNNDIDAIDDIVSQVKKKPEVTMNYMHQMSREMDIRREAKTEECLNLIRFARKHNISDDEIRSQLKNKSKCLPAEIDELFKQADTENVVIDN